MKILFWTSGFWPNIGGIETFSLQLIETMQARGHQYMVLAHKFHAEMKEDDNYQGIPIKRFAFDALLIKQEFRPLEEYLEGVIKNFQPDVVHLNTVLGWGSLLFLSFKNMFSIPIILTVHSSYVQAETKQSAWADARAAQELPLSWTQFYRGSLAAQILLAVDQVCCVSNWVLREIETQFPMVKSKLKLIYYGLAWPNIAPTPLQFSPPTFLLLGRLRLKKGFDTALQALSLLKKSGLHAEMLLAGEGPARASLECLVDELGLKDSVQFIGKVARAEVPALINQAAVVIIPSYLEAFGLVAVEAMQMKRPVIASYTGGLPESISDRETGLLVPPGDPLSLCKAMQTLLQQPKIAEELGENGHSKAAYFSLEQCAAAYETVFK